MQTIDEAKPSRLRSQIIIFCCYLFSAESILIVIIMMMTFSFQDMRFSFIMQLNDFPGFLYALEKFDFKYFIEFY